MSEQAWYDEEAEGWGAPGSSGASALVLYCGATDV